MTSTTAFPSIGSDHLVLSRSSLYGRRLNTMMESSVWEWNSARNHVGV